MKRNNHSLLRDEILSKVVKPTDHIEKLIEIIAKEHTPCTISKKRNISLTRNGEKQCLILFDGSVALKRISDGMILNAESAPFIFGASCQLAYTRHLYVKTKETSRLLLIPQRFFHEQVVKYHLWQSLAMLQDYSSAKVYAHCMTISQLSAYEIIRSHLLELIDEPNAVKNNITAVNYIMDHSFLSRSGIMRVLSKLKSDGYIHLSRGILTDIIDLPEKMNRLYSKSGPAQPAE